MKRRRKEEEGELYVWEIKESWTRWYITNGKIIIEGLTMFPTELLDMKMKDKRGYIKRIGPYDTPNIETDPVTYRWNWRTQDWSRTII